MKILIKVNSIVVSSNTVKIHSIITVFYSASDSFLSWFYMTTNWKLMLFFSHMLTLFKSYHFDCSTICLVTVNKLALVGCNYWLSCLQLFSFKSVGLRGGDVWTEKISA